jgi:hypothetical protein
MRKQAGAVINQRIALSALFLCILHWACAVAAERAGNSNAAESNMKLPIYNCPKVDRDLKLTGKVDDPLWRNAEAVQLVNPVDGKPGRYRTTARMLYNQRFLYIAFECQDEYVWGTLTERDAPIYEEECVEVFVCPSGKFRQYYELNASPRNTVFDTFILNARPVTGEGRDFRSWIAYSCAGMVTRVHIDGELGVRGARGWSAEYAIPFLSIIGSDNLVPKAGEEWRINLYRIDSPEPKRQELYAWSPTGAPDFHRPWRFGRLRFQE